MRVVLAGHPFASTGMGAQLRSHVAALMSVGIEVAVFDLFRNVARDDAGLRALIEPIETDRLGTGIRVFHINGDEVEPTLDRLYQLDQNFTGGANVIVPAWELETYPAAWAAGLRRFDEVWALSRQIGRALGGAGVESHYVGQSVEPRPGPRLPRRFFGLRESAVLFLAFCDLSSYATRKNPEGVLDFARRLRGRHPEADLQIVLKVKDAERDGEQFVATLRDDADPGIVFMTQPLSARETGSLIAAADCVVSLHRAEGFGRTSGEAMALGRLALATGWSGNLDHMTGENALLVDHTLVPVPEGAYPHAEGAVWAEPDIDHAVRLASSYVADPASFAARSARGRREVLLGHGNRAVGLRAAARLARLRGAPRG